MFCRKSKVGRLCKDFDKLLAKYRGGSERYTQVGTFQQQQPN